MNASSQTETPRLLEQLRQRIRYRHYSRRTEQAYAFWVRRFIKFHDLCHPREMAAREVEEFLNHLVNNEHVASSTHRQALAAILFLYRQVLDVNLPWLQAIGRPKSSAYVPVVLSREEVAKMLACVDASHATIVKLLYGAGLRLMECLRLRVKDVDFSRKVIVVRSGKGDKDRVVMLPAPISADLRQQIRRANSVWADDRARGIPGVEMPERLEKKFPRASESFAWHWVFPSSTLSVDPRTRIHRRHHVYEQTVGRAISRAVNRAGLSEKSRRTRSVTHSQPTFWIGSGYPTPAGIAGS